MQIGIHICVEDRSSGSSIQMEESNLPRGTKIQFKVCLMDAMQAHSVLTIGSL